MKSSGMRRIIHGWKPFGTAALALVLVWAAACGFSQSPTSTAGGTNADSARGAAAARMERSHIGFASQQKLVEHYRKHGDEFGSITMEQYLRQAQALRDRPAGGMILENIRKDGVVTRFDRASGDFIACNPNGIIRTYFKPAAGEAYYRRQLKRAH